MNSPLPHAAHYHGTGNALRFTLGELVVWFSYETPVAFSHPSTGLVCRENEWGPTTGRHLNAIEPDRAKRIPGGEFEARLRAVLPRKEGAA